MTPSTAIFWPVIAQVLLTYGIYMVVSARRLGAVKAGTAKVSDFKVPSIEPEPSATAARNLVNQFETPGAVLRCLPVRSMSPAGQAPWP